jgi:hypothetical protein
VTDAGTPNDALELESATAIPPVVAGAEMDTVPVAVWPLRMVVGFTETPLRTIGLIVRFAVVLTPA